MSYGDDLWEVKPMSIQPGMQVAESLPEPTALQTGRQKSPLESKIVILGYMTMLVGAILGGVIGPILAYHNIFGELPEISDNGFWSFYFQDGWVWSVVFGPGCAIVAELLFATVCLLVYVILPERQKIQHSQLTWPFWTQSLYWKRTASMGILGLIWGIFICVALLSQIVGDGSQLLLRLGVFEAAAFVAFLVMGAVGWALFPDSSDKSLFRRGTVGAVVTAAAGLAVERILNNGPMVGACVITVVVGYAGFALALFSFGMCESGSPPFIFLLKAILQAMSDESRASGHDAGK
jgi:hypothetical protein